MTDHGRSILVVDDDPFARAFAEAVLGRAGYRVSQAGSADEALELIDRQHPDLVLLDYAMPVRTGLDVLLAMRAGRASDQTAIIVLSAWAAPEARQAVEQHGAVWLAKPVSADILVATVARCLT